MSDDGPRTGIVVGGILLAGVVAALLVTSLMQGWGKPSTRTGDDTSFPADIDGKPILTVQDAQAFQAKDDGTAILVEGWYQQPMALPCPAPQPGSEPLLEASCEVNQRWLMQQPESLMKITPNSSESTSPGGPAFNAVLDGPGDAWARPLPQNGASTPTPVVFLGHFNDPRAQKCITMGPDQCGDIFVVTEVAWADGTLNP